MAYLCCINKLSVYLFLYFAISETNRLSLSLTSTKMRLLTTLLPCLGVITAVIGTDGEAVVPQGLNENQRLCMQMTGQIEYGNKYRVFRLVRDVR